MYNNNMYGLYRKSKYERNEKFCHVFRQTVSNAKPVSRCANVPDDEYTPKLIRVVRFVLHEYVCVYTGWFFKHPQISL